MTDVKRLETLLDDLQGRIDATKLAAIQDTIDRIEELEAKLAKALTALVEVREFVKDLEPYADQGHSLVPALQKACLTLAELTGEKK